MPNLIVSGSLFCLAAYICVLLVFCLLQRRLLYFPSAERLSTPAHYGAPFEPVTIKTRDGNVISAWWLQQENTAAPALLYCHGNGGNLTFYSEVAKIFFDYGWNALLFDYRGYGDSSRLQPTEEGLAVDAESAYEWIKARGFPESRIFIWGQSLGAAVAARLAGARHPAALILENAFTSLYEEGRSVYPWLLVRPWMILDKYETIKHVSKRKMPLLVIHAENDSVIPLKLGRKLYEAAAEPKHFLLIPGIDHNDFPSVHTKYTDRLKDFVNSALSACVS